jgi:hypothetical protein
MGSGGIVAAVVAIQLNDLLLVEVRREMDGARLGLRADEWCEY